MKQLRILMCSLYAPYPPYDGGAIRTIQSLKILSSHHQVTFVGTYAPESELLEPRRDHLLQYVQNVTLVAEPIIQPRWTRMGLFQEILDYPPRRLTRFIFSDYVRVVMAQFHQSFDLIVCNTILPGQIFASHSVSGCKLLDVLDVLATSREREWRIAQGGGLTRFARWVDWKKTAYYEQKVWANFDALVAISQSDLQMLQRVCPSTPAAMLPIGLEIPQEKGEGAGPPRFDALFVAKWDYPPNIDALEYFDREVLPYLTQVRPQLQIALVGKNPAQSVVEIAKRHSNYSLFPNVANVASYYRESKAVIIPMRGGSGVKVKLLEAMAYGMPIITTSAGADGIPVQNGEHLLIADRPDAMARALLNVLDDDTYASYLGRQARKLVERTFEVSAIQSQYLDFVERIVQTHRVNSVRV